MASERLYLVKNEAGEEMGPADQDALVIWAKDGKITPGCKVRSTLIPQWEAAGSVDFLKPFILAQQEAAVRKKQNSIVNIIKRRIFLRAEDIMADSGLVKVRLENYPRANLLVRYMAGLTDTVMMALLAAGIAYLCTLLFQHSVFGKEQIFYVGFSLFWVLCLLYFTLSIAYCTQTLGQRYWGIFLIKQDGQSFWVGRAFFYTIFMIPLGIFSALFALTSENKLSAQEYLTGTRMVKLKLISKKQR
ncbi:MAG: RDD family protein [Lentisphaeria bacterium]|nr:RDD family protein [Lentisphaeria bacterium]